MDYCPHCAAPITYLPGDAERPPITVYFLCPNERCPYGKLTDEELAQAKAWQAANRT